MFHTRGALNSIVRCKLGRKRCQMEYSPRCWCAHLKIPRTSKRAAWKVPSANEKCAISHTVRCSNLELTWRRWWDDRAHRVSESVQSKNPRYRRAHLKIPTTTKRAAWLVPSANEECARSYTVRCSNLELHSTRLWEARAKRVGEGTQSKILMYALENSNDLKTGSKVGAISKW